MKRDFVWFFVRLLILLLAVWGVEWWRWQRGVERQSDPWKSVKNVQIPKAQIEANVTQDQPTPQLEENITEANVTLPQPPQPTMEERLSLLGANIGDPVFIRIFKYTAELELWIKAGEKFELLQTYEVCRQSGYLGPKEKEGDKQGPEGFYEVTKERLNPNSQFHLAFNIGYPNEFDRLHHRTGSALMVHGGCLSVGCFAMTDEKIEEIYELVERALDENGERVGVHIFPFRMNAEAMERYSSHRWFDFWSNLKEGYDYFETHRVPPQVKVKQKRYIFDE